MILNKLFFYQSRTDVPDAPYPDEDNPDNPFPDDGEDNDWGDDGDGGDDLPFPDDGGDEDYDDGDDSYSLDTPISDDTYRVDLDDGGYWITDAQGNVLEWYNADGTLRTDEETTTTRTTATYGSNNNTNEKLVSDEEKKILSDRDKLVGSGIFMNHKYALVDEEVEHGVIPTNAGKYKISIFLSPKFRMNGDIFTKDQAIFLKYNDVVQEINLVDDIDSIGLKGYIELKNPGSHLDIFLERHNNYYVIINFTKYSDKITEDSELILEKPAMKFEPYIFDIDYVENISSPETEQKSLRIWLVDIVTSILRTHSIASVIKHNRDITSRRTYKQVLADIMLYVRNYIKVNTNNKYLYHKPLMYTHMMKCNGVRKNGNDEGVDMSGLVKSTFKKIHKNASIKEALDEILTDCCTTLTTPPSFAKRYMNIGNVLIPFFFKEEYPDPYFVYSGCWTDMTENKRGEAHPEFQGDKARLGHGGVEGTGGSSYNGETDFDDSVLMPHANMTDEDAGLMPDWLREDDGENGEQDNPIQTVYPSQRNTRNTVNPADVPTPAEKETGRKYGADFGNNTLNFLNDVKIWNLYAKNNGSKSSIKLYDTSYGGKANVLVNRQMTMRDIFMPFYVAFGTDKYYGVYEDINPAKSPDNEDVVPLLGVYQGDLKSFQFNPINMNTVSRLWKNMVFLDCANNATAAHSTLIFFSWFFDYFQEVFLNGISKPLCSNVMPDFFMLSRMEKIKHASKSNDTFENKFDEYNAYTYATYTGDSLKECLRVMGKNLASFTLINDSYIFRIHGNLFRRPNEIIRLGYRGNRLGEGMQMVSYQTGMNFRDMTYLYVRKVTHIFRGDTYDNIIEGCKICEILGDLAEMKKLLKEK